MVAAVTTKFAKMMCWPTLNQVILFYFDLYNNHTLTSLSQMSHKKHLKNTNLQLQ